MRILKTAFLTLITIILFVSCKKEYSYEGGKIVNGGTWQFQNTTVQYNGNIDSASIQNAGGTKVLTLIGTSLTGPETFRIQLFTTGSFTTTSYLASLSEVGFDYFTTSKTTFKGDFLAGEFTVNITSLSNNIITGTFSGTAEDSTGAQTQITSGSFTSTIDLTNNGTGTISVGTLGASTDSCTPIILSGIYKEGLTFSESNKLQLEVNVTSPGTYIIATNAVNGVNFFKAGTFTTSGVQNLILDGSGTPQSEGEEIFIVTYGNSYCSFSVTFEAPDPPATGTLGGAGGTCTPITPSGTYTEGIALDASNTITIQANVTTIGPYDITTDLVNGVSFSSSGSFTGTGVQTITLAGSGIPTNSGLENFAVTFGASTCNFSITFDAPPSPATGTLGGGGGTCTPVTPAGVYTQGISLGASNTITIQANVASIGPYEITTNTINGVTFTGTGNFTTTGIKDIVLTGSGTPLNSGIQTFTVTFSTSTCDFPITFAAGAPAVYSCKIDGVFTSFSDRAEADVTDDFYAPPLPYLYLDGHSGPPNGSTVPEFEIFIVKNDNSAVTAGTYNVDGVLLPNGYTIEIDYKVENPDLSVTIWGTSSTIIPPANPAFTITITSITSSRVIGTFSGTLTNALEGSTAFKVITEGVFDLPIQ